MQPTTAALQQIAYFRHLSAEDLHWIISRVSCHQFDSRATVIHEGQPCEGFYALLDGRATIYKVSRSGRKQVLAILQPGDTFNEVPIFDGGPNAASVETLETSTMLFIPRETALDLVSRSPHAALVLLASFAARLRGLMGLVESLAFDDVTSRLAHLLVQLARSEGRQSPEGIEISRAFTVQDLAALVGSVREVVTRCLSHLEHEGLVRVSRSTIIVLNLDRLELLADG